MGFSEIIAVVAGVVTVVAFLLNVWQYAKLKAAEQTLQSIRNIAQAAFVDYEQMYKCAESEMEKEHYRTLAGFIISILNLSWAFLQARREEILQPGAGSGAFVHLGDRIFSNRRNDNEGQTERGD